MKDDSDVNPKDQDYPYAGSDAARMLANALRRMSEDRGVSVRQLAKKLNYKQAVVLSHMANGRVAIPIDKAPEIANATGLSASEFLMAVMDQRHPAAFQLLMGSAAFPIDLPPSGVVEELEAIAGVGLDQLSAEQKEVLREVVADPRPARRWLSVAEISAMQLLRRLRPTVSRRGLDVEDRGAITNAMERKGG